MALSILNLMIKDHEKINIHLEDLKKSLNKPRIKRTAFDKFRWELEKHLFLEEKAIFLFFEPESEEEYSLVPSLLEDHKKILTELNDLNHKIKHNHDLDLNKIANLITNHKSLEEEGFYPIFDQRLEESEKQEISKRIKTLV